MKGLLTKKVDNSTSPQESMKTAILSSCIWHDNEKFESVKAPPAKSVLLVKKPDDLEKSIENQN